MAPFKSICITALTTLLLVATGPTAHHLYEIHLSSGYASILKATLQSSNIQEQARYIHQARLAVRTMKDRESEARLEKLQGDADGSFVTDGCGNWKFAADLWEQNRRPADANLAFDSSNDAPESQIAELEGKTYRPRGATGADLKDPYSESARGKKVSESYRTCLATKEAAARKDGDRIKQELRTAAGLPSD
jgi:hypothetical protein